MVFLGILFTIVGLFISAVAYAAIGPTAGIVCVSLIAFIDGTLICVFIAEDHPIFNGVVPFLCVLAGIIFLKKGYTIWLTIAFCTCASYMIGQAEYELSGVHYIVTTTYGYNPFWEVFEKVSEVTEMVDEGVVGVVLHLIFYVGFTIIGYKTSAHFLMYLPVVLAGIRMVVYVVDGIIEG